ncbi:hypothetical protein HpNP133_01700 [Helicobacter pylori]
MLKAFLWANTKPKTPKAKKMTKFFQNDKKKTLSCYNALNTMQMYSNVYKIPNTNNLIQKEHSFNLFSSRFHYALSCAIN